MNRQSSFKHAHGAGITGVATSPYNECIFTTTSRDKSTLLWDTRVQLPASGLYENHDFAFTAVAWNSIENSESNYIYVGDDIGNLYFIDKRKPNEFSNTIGIFDTRGIMKLKMKE